MFGEIAQLLIRTVFGLLVFAFLLRFWMQATRAPFRNPVGQFLVALTDWAVVPARKVIPGYKGHDLATLVLAIVTQGAMLTLLYATSGRGWPVGGIFVQAIVQVLQQFLQLVIFVTLIQVVMSWVAPYNPLAPVFEALTRPFYNFFRRFIPPIGGIDLSPLFIVLGAQILMIVLDNLHRIASGVFA
jgi:YggT family protein